MSIPAAGATLDISFFSHVQCDACHCLHFRIRNEYFRQALLLKQVLPLLELDECKNTIIIQLLSCHCHKNNPPCLQVFQACKLYASLLNWVSNEFMSPKIKSCRYQKTVWLVGLILPAPSLVVCVYALLLKVSAYQCLSSKICTDDIVLLSWWSHGLQSLLDSMQHFCEGLGNHPACHWGIQDWILSMAA